MIVKCNQIDTMFTLTNKYQAGEDLHEYSLVKLIQNKLYSIGVDKEEKKKLPQHFIKYVFLEKELIFFYYKDNMIWYQCNDTHNMLTRKQDTKGIYSFDQHIIIQKENVAEYYRLHKNVLHFDYIQEGYVCTDNYEGTYNIYGNYTIEIENTWYKKIQEVDYERWFGIILDTCKKNEYIDIYKIGDRIPILLEAERYYYDTHITDKKTKYYIGKRIEENMLCLEKIT